MIIIYCSLTCFQEPGEIEAEISRVGGEQVLKKILTSIGPGPIRLPKEDPFGVDPEIALPSWFSEADLEYYASKFNQTGFTGGLNYYRALDLYALFMYSLHCLC